jgi:predicted house-cleaning noncanonical NTP pyrophosphatase (MazG superfamily)
MNKTNLSKGIMIKFILNKIGRDKGIEQFKSQNITPKYRLLAGIELCDSLKIKLLEESAEVRDAKTIQDVTAELADLAEVIDGLCTAYGISQNDLRQVKEERRKTRGF